jgi:putative transcriptional regulator
MKLSKLGKPLINAAKSAQAIAKGEADPKTYRVHVPAHLDVRAIRTKLKMSQNAFAACFGILPFALRDWEQNRRHPDGAARPIDGHRQEAGRSRRLICSFRLRRSRRPGVPRSERRLEPDRWRVNSR